MNRADLQTISAVRRREARALLNLGHHSGAYYLAGYAVECALKACIAKQVRRYDFPDKKLAVEIYTHDLERLLRLAGLALDLERDMKTNAPLELNWGVVKDWSEISRYDVQTTAVQARDMYSACTARRHGVLSWVKQRW